MFGRHAGRRPRRDTRRDHPDRHRRRVPRSAFSCPDWDRRDAAQRRPARHPPPAWQRWRARLHLVRLSERCLLFHGYTSQHDYTLFEGRAANGELLPDLRDETLLELEREHLDFALRVGPGLRALILAAVGSPGIPQRGCVGALLRLEVTVIIVPIDDSALADLFISIALPLHDDDTIPPPDWPGSELQARLVELALGGEPANWEIPRELPSEDGRDRPADLARELPIAVRNVDPALLD